MNIRPQSFLLFLVSVLLLATSFFNNRFQIVDQNWFDNHQKDTESLVIGRMVKAKRDGIFSAGGLTGQITGIQGKKETDRLQWSGGTVDGQYQAYYNDLGFTSFNPYFSQIGFQAIIFSFIDKILPLSPSLYIIILKILNASLFSLVLSLIVFFFYLEFGLFSAILVLLTTLFSQWITVFGRNLWWVMWAFYLPFLASIHHLEKKTTKTMNLLLVYTAVLIKCFLNGYEYITTTLIMMVTPYIYYWVVEGWKFKCLVKRILVAGITSTIAVLSSTIVLATQIAAVKGGLKSGLHHIFVYSVGKRTHGDASSYPEVYANSLKTDVLTVIKKYLNGFIFDFSQKDINLHLKIKYQTVIIIFAFFSLFTLLFYFYFRKSKSFELSDSINKLLALTLAVWFSFLAPLSWMVVFKGHAYIHTHMNFITWHMPFAVLGFGLIGSFLSFLVSLIFSLRSSQRRRLTP